MVQFITIVPTPMISYIDEKSALDTEDIVSWFDENNKNSNVRHGKDLLLALLNTDEYACYPNAIKIDNSPVFKLDMSFQTQKVTKMKEIYNPSGAYALGDPNRLNASIKACRLENIYALDVNGNIIYMTDSNGQTLIDETGNQIPKVEGQFLHYYILTNPPT